jgi:DNA-binding response OmpR family regulator
VDDLARLVICEDDADLRRRILLLAESSGLEVVAVTDRWSDAMSLVVENEAQGVVVDVATVGQVGLRLLQALRRLAPSCRILLVSDLPDLAEAAQAAGADVVVSPSDLRPLASAFEQLRTEPQSAV